MKSMLILMHVALLVGGNQDFGKPEENIRILNLNKLPDVSKH